MNKRERARVVKDLRLAAAVANVCGCSAGTAVGVINSTNTWTVAMVMSRRALINDKQEYNDYFHDIPHAPLALLMVAAAVEAGDWP